MSVGSKSGAAGSCRLRDCTARGEYLKGYILKVG